MSHYTVNKNVDDNLLQQNSSLNTQILSPEMLYKGVEDVTWPFLELRGIKIKVREL